MIPGNMTPCRGREAIVTVVSYCNGIMNGYLQHPRLDKTEQLHSLSQMVLVLGSLLDLEECPGHPMPFVPPLQGSLDTIAVFRIQILFREHYTWQGRLVWQDENQEAVFHSGIELIQLFDEVLAEEGNTT